MAINDLDYCRQERLPATAENLAYVERVRLAGRWLRARAFCRCEEAAERAGGGLRGPNAPEVAAYRARFHEIEAFEARAMADRRHGRDRKSRATYSRLAHLRNHSPLRSTVTATADLDGLALFDHVRTPFMF